MKVAIRLRYQDRMEKQTSLNAALGAFVIALSTLALGIALQGIVFSYLWVWYLVPLGLPVIGILHAYMLVMMARIVMFRPNLEKRNKDESLKAMSMYVGAWLTVWAIGWLLSSYV